MSRKRSLQTATLALSLFVAFALASAGSAKAGRGHGHGHGPHGFMLERQIEKLDLPAETRSAVQAVFDAARPGQDALRDQIRAARDSMHALLDQPTVDEAAVMAQADAIGALMTQSRKQDLQTLIQVRNLLTPEQRAALEQQMEKRRERGWHGKHGKRCPEGSAHGEAKPSEGSES